MPRVILHVGMPKTVTTSTQESFYAARAEVARNGVFYAWLGGTHTGPIFDAFNGGGQVCTTSTPSGT